MGSLTEAYDRRVGDGGGRGARGRGVRKRGEKRDGADAVSAGRPYLGAGLLAVSNLLLGGAVVLATSSTVATLAGLSAIAAAELARALAGLGAPLVFLGALALRPTARRANALAVIGAGLALAGVGGFVWAYPDRWLGDPLDLTLPVASLYALGVFVSFLALVYGVFGAERGASETEESTEPGPRGRSSRTSLR